MRSLYIRTLAVTAIVQFFVTRTLAGRALEEGQAERLWLMYPLNTAINAAIWTLLVAGAGRVARFVRRIA
jgi:tellurite resistance protein TehA-like permease